MDPGICKHCHKRIYLTFPFAMKQALQRTKRTGVMTRVYPCPYHNGYHHSSQPRWQKEGE